MVWQLDELSCAEHAVVQRPASPITAMCACPGGAMLALFTADGRLLVVSTGELDERVRMWATVKQQAGCWRCPGGVPGLLLILQQAGLAVLGGYAQLGPRVLHGFEA